MGTTLEDVSYSIKQNGIMINLDYVEPIDDDDIIGWKSDRGWVYLTLLGVRAPKNKIPQQNFNGAVRKIVIDDFDESTQLAILINKPVLGYDIINSKTSPSTIVFIHTEMKQSEVVSLKQHIEKEGKSVFNVAKSSGFPKFNTNFRNAFDQARKELGPNAIFEYHGKLYTTNHPGEKEAKSKSILMINERNTKKNKKEGNYNTPKVYSSTITEKNFEELYIDKNSGEILTELIEDSLIANNLPREQALYPKQIIKNDSIEFVDEKSLINSTEFITQNTINNKKKKEKVWKKLFGIFSNTRLDQNNKQDGIKKNNIEILSNENFNKLVKDSMISNLPADITKLQKTHVPTKLQNIDVKLTDKEFNNISQTQLSDSTKVQELQLTDLPPLETDIYKQLQKQYVPSDAQNILGDTLRSFYRTTSLTQSPDTNIVKAWFTDESVISDEYDPRYLQKQHIPSNAQNILGDTLRPSYRTTSLTQLPDTNIVKAWFTDESVISDEYDPRHLQQQYIPSENNNLGFNPSSDSSWDHSLPQNPEFTSPSVLENRFKTQYKSKNRFDRSKREIEKKFEPNKKENNTWLSFFPLQSDSIKKSLKWDFNEEYKIPLFLQREKESLDYSSRDNLDYTWKKELSNARPKSFPPRYSDPGFRYYHEGGIRVESNIDGIPIYIDGKYVGETPLKRPIQVEPGWHQVSGFSPVYTHLASKKGLQFVGYDSIINNNELYGSTTVYAEAGKLETVSLKFNHMGDTPKKWREISGGMNLSFPMFSLLIGLIAWAM